MPTRRAYRRYRWVTVPGFHGSRPAGSGENANASSGTCTPSAPASARRRRKCSWNSSQVSRSSDRTRPSPSLRCLLDVLALLDQVVAGQADLLADEVEPVLAQGADLTAARSGGERGPQVQAELLVLGPDQVEQPRRLVRGGRIGLALARVRRAGVLGDVAVCPVVADSQVQGRGDDRVDAQDRGRAHRLARVQTAADVALVRAGGPVVPQRPAPLIAGMRPVHMVLGPREPAAQP